MQLKIIITGATGFVGEGVLLACLEHPQISEVLIVNRRHLALQHPKLKECIVADFMNLDAVNDQLTGYDACFYCAGISSVGLKEAAYTHITYDTTLHFAKTLLALNPDLVFNFVSGSHTDSSEQGRIMWARVKGKTENALMKLPFKAEYNFRPGGMKAFPGQKNAKTPYKLIVGLIGLLSPKRVVTLQEIGQAMVNAVLKGYSKQILEMDDIKALANA
ncbi:NAD-dependent epimerase/dehydratase family protein [Spirosoma sp. HMF4905]|uniref:NAD-dependent epimerase/dehydratase family protein n=1 Tax=Spirosoma arboris TaxID=2682092 RepID=A0A7K1S5F2_9BACT|nr:NAD-dependent epimerase/dehydratase family protein [Spirosoma arboris]MVM28975.1 NAD-dependent epimerase/dehydratase family protein [Spirosoma arboris]